MFWIFITLIIFIKYLLTWIIHILYIFSSDYIIANGDLNPETFCEGCQHCAWPSNRWRFAVQIFREGFDLCFGWKVKPGRLTFYWWSPKRCVTCLRHPVKTYQSCWQIFVIKQVVHLRLDFCCFREPFFHCVQQFWVAAKEKKHDKLVLPKIVLRKSM